jgi:hypothetical protein
VWRFNDRILGMEQAGCLNGGWNIGNNFLSSGLFGWGKVAWIGILNGNTIVMDKNLLLTAEMLL